MDVLECIGGLPDDMSYIFRGKYLIPFALPEPVREGAFLAKRHHHISERTPVETLLSKVKQGQDMWMIERSDGLHLSLKEAHRFSGCVDIRVGCGFVSYHLDSDLAG